MRSVESESAVLFVDDDNSVSSGKLAKLFEPFKIKTAIRHPEEVLQADLDRADLVVVDYFLSSWGERDAVDSVARSPRDGLAVCANLRSMLLPTLQDRTQAHNPARQVAFALWSSHLPEASFGLPDVLIPHLFARENNLEWAFPRDLILESDGARAVASLAAAVRELPTRWGGPEGDAKQDLWRFLGIADVAFDWTDRAREQVLACHPPVFELGTRSGGMAVIRWLLHRIMPYPCFLLSDDDVAARLRVDSSAIEGSTAFSSELSEYQYNGVLSSFGERFWWRAGIENWTFDATAGEPGNPDALADALRRFGLGVNTASLNPVRYVTPSLARPSESVDISRTVRIQPDDWPPYADTAFALIDDVVADPMFRMLVDPLDTPVIEVQF